MDWAFYKQDFSTQVIKNQQEQEEQEEQEKQEKRLQGHARRH